MNYLSEFGEPAVVNNYEKVEKYIVHCLKPHTACNTFFDALHFSENMRVVPITELPPTSHSIVGYIL